SLVNEVEKVKGGEADMPVTKSGLELHLTLIAQAAGQALKSRIFPSFEAAHRLVSERATFADPNSTYSKSMKDAENDKASAWHKIADSALRYLDPPGSGARRARAADDAGKVPDTSPDLQNTIARLDKIRAINGRIENQLKEWPNAVKNAVSVEG